MPSLQEYIHFDADSYRERTYKFSDKRLQENIYKKRGEINAAGWTIGADLALIPITGGLSALALPIPARSIQIDHQKLRLLENEWNRRGHATLPSRVRDFVVPCVIAGTIGVVDMGVGHALSAAGSSTVNQAALAGGAHMATGTLQTHTMPPGTGHQFWNGAEYGAQQGIQALVHPNTTQFATASPYINPAFAAGQGVGMNAAHQGFDYAAQKLGNWVQDQFIGRRR